MVLRLVRRRRRALARLHVGGLPSEPGLHPPMKRGSFRCLAPHAPRLALQHFRSREIVAALARLPCLNLFRELCRRPVVHGRLLGPRARASAWRLSLWLWLCISQAGSLAVWLSLCRARKLGPEPQYSHPQHVATVRVVPFSAVPPGAPCHSMGTLSVPRYQFRVFNTFWCHDRDFGVTHHNRPRQATHQGGAISSKAIHSREKPRGRRPLRETRPAPRGGGPCCWRRRVARSPLEPSPRVALYRHAIKTRRLAGSAAFIASEF